VFIIGGTSAGSDYITMYLSEVKNKSVGSMFVLLNSCFMIGGVTLGSFASSVIADPQHYGNFSTFFTPNLIISLLEIWIIGAVINRFFP
jgi:uncharacterized membrane-anchored protein YitT (DUF2179 family)